MTLRCGSVDADVFPPFSLSQWKVSGVKGCLGHLVHAHLVSDPDELVERNVWNLFCHADIGTFIEALADEKDLGRVALSCHFALDILCDKSDTLCSISTSSGTTAIEVAVRLGTIAAIEFIPSSDIHR